MKSKRFFISLIVFLTAFILIDRLNLSIGEFKVINLKVVLLFIYAIFMWTAQVAPNSFISVFLILIIGILKLDSFPKVISYTFGNTVFIFILSIIIISYAFKKSGLADRVSQSLLSLFGDSKRKTLLSLMFTSYFLGMFLTAIAAVSISLPIALRIVETNHLEKGNRYAKACLLGITYGGLIGGTATPLGTPVNLLMIQYLKELGNFNLSFLHWVAIGLPLSFILFYVGYLLLIFMLKIDNVKIDKPVSNIMPLTTKEKRSVIAFGLIMLMFLMSQYLEQFIPWLSLDMNILSVFCCLMVALPPFEIVEWKSMLKELDWESLIFLVGSIALGYLLYNTHTADLIAGTFFSLTGDLNIYLYVFVFCAFTIIMHLMLSSNTVTGTVIVPILISLSQRMGVSPWYVVAPAVYCISLAFILPTESPTNIITYNTGYFEMKDMLKIGTVLTVLCIVIISLFLISFGSMTGLYIIG